MLCDLQTLDAPLLLGAAVGTTGRSLRGEQARQLSSCIHAAAAPRLGHSATFLYDLVDLTRQALANIAPIFYLKVKEAYR